MTQEPYVPDPPPILKASYTDVAVLEEFVHRRPDFNPAGSVESLRGPDFNPAGSVESLRGPDFNPAGSVASRSPRRPDFNPAGKAASRDST